MLRRPVPGLALRLLAALLLVAGPCFALAGIPTMNQEPDGIAVRLASGQLRLQVISESVIRVEFSISPSFFSRTSIDRVPLRPSLASFRTGESPTEFVLSTAALRVMVNRRNGAVSFADAAGHRLLSEVPGGRSLVRATVQGEQTFHIQQKWSGNQDESLYGLGQMQLGIVDIKGYDLDLWQHNTNVVVPFLESSRGYGVLWDNTSFTRFGNLNPFQAIPAADLYDVSGRPGGLTVTTLDGSEPPRQTPDISLDSVFPHTRLHVRRRVWCGSVLAPQTGDYQFQAYSNGGIRVWFDGRLVMNHWRQNWLTAHDQIRMHLEAGRKYPIRIENDPEQQSTLQFRWKTSPPNQDTSLWSQVGDGIDYYFVYGPSLDKVIDGYRLLTGKATMLPNWAFGLWQSRQRYRTAKQSLAVVKEFRKRNIPFDNIVQDWQYWRPDAWGSHQFDPARFPDPAGWISAIHAQHTHLMISVWGKFNPHTDNGTEMEARGYLYQPNLKEHIRDWTDQPYSFYDAFNPGARKLFWSQINTRLFAKGVDAWWMDATEPDLMPSPPTLVGQQTHMNPTWMGTGSRMLNGYALENSEAIYAGQRTAAPSQRVFILTRSGFAGEQRYSTVTWSGDTTSTWTALAKQIPAGLGAAISGLPYWTMDTGGYTMQRRFARRLITPAAQDEWRELNARWFELSTFTPILRVHGELRPREMWTLGNNSPAYRAELKFDRLRYALFPYIYSLAGWSTQQSYTMMRPLVMDFPRDRIARELPDEYMFGPALLVAPITHYRQRARTVYLPPAAAWYDYWTGLALPSGTLSVPAPYDEIPLFVRAGSIIPYGPVMQYIGEEPSDPVTLCVYAGADGAFTLYEDEGTNFNYEKGAFSQIAFRWNEKEGTLTIGKRTGTYSGMRRDRTFQVVLISRAHPQPFSFTPRVTRKLRYTGTEVRLRLE